MGAFLCWNKGLNSAAWCCLPAVCCQSNRGTGAARAVLQGRAGAAAWHPLPSRSGGLGTPAKGPWSFCRASSAHRAPKREKGEASGDEESLLASSGGASNTANQPLHPPVKLGFQLPLCHPAPARASHLRPVSDLSVPRCSHYPARHPVFPKVFPHLRPWTRSTRAARRFDRSLCPPLLTVCSGLKRTPAVSPARPSQTRPQAASKG